MKASWKEDYFKALIRLRLLLPVNPKAGTQKCDRCHIVARREPCGPLAYGAEMLGRNVQFDEVPESVLAFLEANQRR